MNSKSSSERMADALERARHHWKARPRMEVEAVPAAPTAFTIALSRQAGTNGSTIGHGVAERLGWPVYGRELLQRIAEDLGLRTSLLESVDERHVSWLANA